VFHRERFALMGLRQLYFRLGDIAQAAGLPVPGAFVHPGVHRREARPARLARERVAVSINGGEHVPVPEIPTLASLGVIVVTLVITTVASL